MTQLELKLTNSNSGGCKLHRAHKLIVISDRQYTVHCLTATSFPHWVDCLSAYCMLTG